MGLVQSSISWLGRDVERAAGSAADWTFTRVLSVLSLRLFFHHVYSECTRIHTCSCIACATIACSSLIGALEATSCIIEALCRWAWWRQVHALLVLPLLAYHTSVLSWVYAVDLSLVPVILKKDTWYRGDAKDIWILLASGNRWCIQRLAYTSILFQCLLFFSNEELILLYQIIRFRFIDRGCVHVGWCTNIVQTLHVFCVC